MKCIIVDDDPMSRASLKALCKKIPELELAGMATDGIEGLDLLKTQEVDLVFLDIEMPELSGMELAKTGIRLPEIIFTTGKKDYAFEAYEVNAVDYLSKPVTMPRLLQAVEKVKLKMKEASQSGNRNPEEFYIRVDGRLVRLQLDDILYVESTGDYVTFFTEKERFIVHSTLKEMEKRLNHDKLLRVHRSYIVNLNKLVDIEDGSLVINRKVIPISRANRPLLMERLNVV